MSIGLAALAAGPAIAHHSMAANFDISQRITKAGVLEKFEWTNPHVHLFVDVQTRTGAVDTWSFEGPAPSFFRNRSFSRSDFEDSIGKTVTVEASPARDGSDSGLIRQVTLANGVVVSACPQNC
jgi:hypothetical protein